MLMINAANLRRSSLQESRRQQQQFVRPFFVGNETSTKIGCRHTEAYKKLGNATISETC